MGWAGGSEVASKLWALVRDDLPEDKRSTIARKFIRVFEDQDCDTMYEAVALKRDARRPRAKSR
jgi:hypothetical protein